MYSVRGRNSATAATADHAVAALWNPHATQRIMVVQWQLFCQTAPGAGLAYRFRRITTRGTPGSTVTPDRNNHSIYGVAPPSGALLDLGAYSVQPTEAGEFAGSYVPAAIIASGIVLNLGNIEVPPGTGLALVQVAATASPVFEHVPSWREDW